MLTSHVDRRPFPSIFQNQWQQPHHLLSPMFLLYLCSELFYAPPVSEEQTPHSKKKVHNKTIYHEVDKVEVEIRQNNRTSKEWHSKIV